MAATTVGHDPLVPAQLEQAAVEFLVEREELLEVDARRLLLPRFARSSATTSRVRLGGDVVERGEFDGLPQELRVGDAGRG